LGDALRYLLAVADREDAVRATLEDLAEDGTVGDKATTAASTAAEDSRA